MYQISEQRFSDAEIKSKNKVWEVLCRDFFQKFIPANATVLDLGAGRGEFINHISCGKKIACDVNPVLAQSMNPGVEFICCPTTDLSKIPPGSIDVVFLSNVLEHLDSRADILKTMREVQKTLARGGKFILLHPNIRFVKGAYWDFFDHQIPLTEKSLEEALQATGFVISRSIDRFLPYTSKTGLPQHAFFVRAYLALPVLWKIFGGQSFIVAEKSKT